MREVLSQLADNSEDAERILKENGLDAAGFRTSMAISPEAHVRMQAAWQKHVTNSVSKTINLPNSATVENVADAYLLAWKTECKAVTVYRDGSKSMQVLETGASDKKQDDEELLVPRQRPASVRGVTDRVRTGHGNMFVTVNFDEDGSPFEVFTTHGKAGGCDAAHLDGISRLISMALRSGIDPNQVVEHLQGITCCPVWDGGTLVRSAEDAVALVLKNQMAVGEAGPIDHVWSNCPACDVHQERQRQRRSRSVQVSPSAPARSSTRRAALPASNAATRSASRARTPIDLRPSESSPTKVAITG